MGCLPNSPFLQRLGGRINLESIPFSDRGSRLLVFRRSSRLSVRLAERWFKWEDEVGHYRQRPPMVDDLVVTDENGNPVDFTLSAFPHAVCIGTPLGDLWLAFEDEETLYFDLPRGRLGLAFRVYATRGHTDRRGGEFKGDPEHRRTHRNVAYTTNARVLSNSIDPDANGYQQVRLQLDASEGVGFVLNITPRLGFNRSVAPADEILRKAEERWHDWFVRAPEVEEKYASQYYYAWWILRSGLLSSRYFLTREAMSPSIIHYVGVWQWDAFFHALAYQHIDQLLAENQVRVLLDHQRDDGMIPDAVHDEGVITRWKLPGSDQEAEVTKPPLLAWIALKLYAKSRNRDFLEEVYEPIVRWQQWWFDRNDEDRDGIVQYNHPNSSGLDDSPLWDEGMPVESPDLNTYLVMQADALAQIAEIIGLADQSAKWRAEAASHTNRMIVHFWDERAHLFWAMHQHRPLQVLTPFSIFPLLTARLPRLMNEQLLAHLIANDEFWTNYPVPTVACRDPKFDPNQMWRGPTWMNINYLFIEGLMRCGFVDVARTLRDKTLELMMQHEDIYEYYNPETGQPPESAAPTFGWSSAVFVDLAIKASRGEII